MSCSRLRCRCTKRRCRQCLILYRLMIRNWLHWLLWLQMIITSVLRCSIRLLKHNRRRMHCRWLRVQRLLMLRLPGRRRVKLLRLHERRMASPIHRLLHAIVHLRNCSACSCKPRRRRCGKSLLLEHLLLLLLLLQVMLQNHSSCRCRLRLSLLPRMHPLPRWNRRTTEET